MRKLLLVLALMTLSLFGASFDCSKATSDVEKMICKDDELSKMDENLTITFWQAMNKVYDKSELKKEQSLWIKERNKCQDIKCIQTQYVERIKALQNPIGLKSKVEYAVFKGDKTECQKFIDQSDKIQFLGDPYPHSSDEEDHKRDFQQFSAHDIFKKCPNAYVPIQARLDRLNESRKNFVALKDFGNKGDTYRVYENIDIDNDGKDDTVVMYGVSFRNTIAEQYWKVNTETCETEIIYENYASNKLFRFENKIYLEDLSSSKSKLKEIIIYEIFHNESKMMRKCNLIDKAQMPGMCDQAEQDNLNCVGYFNIKDKK